MKTPLKKQQRAIALAAKRLDAAEGPVAKRNARAAMLAALRAMRVAVDRDYPAPRRKPRRIRKNRTVKQRHRDMEANGFVQISGDDLIGRLNAAGIKVATIPNAEGSPFVRMYAPGWAVRIATKRPGSLRAAKRSIKTREALVAELALLGE